MRIDSKLCHISENKAVVQVNGWLNEKHLGSALAEGQTVEIAEDKAISRLNRRISILKSNESTSNSINEENNKTPIKVELPKSEIIENNNIVDEPTDWSNELTAIDSEIKRLSWTRDDEINFLEKSLGYKNRNKITNYGDIVKYLSLLKKIEKPDQFKIVKKDFNTLIEESDIILRDLSWNHIQGREYLQKEFNVSTRMELNEEQLISFISKLKSIRNEYRTH
tara:strand:- start:477 stop:1145 length:669 start_codon:yes stop_codon:yes gene_type:complete